MPNYEPISAKSYAKINLALAVGSPMPAGHEKPGYHPVSSWMACVDLYDDVTLRLLRDSRADSSYVTTLASGKAVTWAPADDLAARAHRALEQEIELKVPIELRIHKRIPAAGGLGGGSSNAGLTLRLLNDALGLRLSEERLVGIASRLGSDVPFFLDLERPTASPPRPALVSGFGERVRRVGPRGEEVVLMFPPFGCATARVYARLDAIAGEHAFRAEAVERLVESGGIDGYALFNDLASAACEVEPQLAVRRSELRQRLGRPVHVSGSGSTLFVLGGAGVAAEARAAAPEFSVVLTRLV